MEIKISDYGQDNIKDLARTMTSVGTVAWTGIYISKSRHNND